RLCERCERRRLTPGDQRASARRAAFDTPFALPPQQAFGALDEMLGIPRGGQVEPDVLAAAIPGAGVELVGHRDESVAFVRLVGLLFRGAPVNWVRQIGYASS